MLALNATEVQSNSYSYYWLICTHDQLNDQLFGLYKISDNSENVFKCLKMFLSKNGLCFLVLITEPLIDHQIADYVSADMTELYKNMHYIRCYKCNNSQYE